MAGGVPACFCCCLQEIRLEEIWLVSWLVHQQGLFPVWSRSVTDDLPFDLRLPC